MAIEKEYDRYVPTCDICGKTLKPEDTFEDARDAMKHAGWESAKIPGGWENYCIICKEEA